MKKLFFLISMFLFALIIVPRSVSADPISIIEDISIEKTDLSSDVVTSVIVQEFAIYDIGTAINERKSLTVAPVSVQILERSAGEIGDLCGIICLKETQNLHIAENSFNKFLTELSVKPRNRMRKNKRYRPPRFGLNSGPQMNAGGKC
jgi:hypothetical protein